MLLTQRRQHKKPLHQPQASRGETLETLLTDLETENRPQRKHHLLWLSPKWAITLQIIPSFVDMESTSSMRRLATLRPHFCPTSSPKWIDLPGPKENNAQRRACRQAHGALKKKTKHVGTGKLHSDGGIMLDSEPSADHRKQKRSQGKTQSRSTKGTETERQEG
jgi:hypothetical protein